MAEADIPASVQVPVQKIKSFKWTESDTFLLISKVYELRFMGRMDKMNKPTHLHGYGRKRKGKNG